ncbi:unnamed protein product [Merluccius merluccius]
MFRGYQFEPEYSGVDEMARGQRGCCISSRCGCPSSSFWGSDSSGGEQLVSFSIRNQTLTTFGGRSSSALVPSSTTNGLLSVSKMNFRPSRTLLVQMLSAAGTGYRFNTKRSRAGDKLVLRKHDPLGNMLK